MRNIYIIQSPEILVLSKVQWQKVATFYVEELAREV